MIAITPIGGGVYEVTDGRSKLLIKGTKDGLRIYKVRLSTRIKVLRNFAREEKAYGHNDPKNYFYQKGEKLEEEAQKLELYEKRNKR